MIPARWSTELTTLPSLMLPCQPINVPEWPPVVIEPWRLDKYSNDAAWLSEFLYNLKRIPLHDDCSSSLSGRVMGR